MTIEIRDIADGQFRDWLLAVNTAFGEDVHEDSVERFRRVLDPLRALGAFDGQAIVGGAAAFSFSLTVPGARQLPAAGVTAVGVMPTHRRQGVLRSMMARQLADARARGEPLAVLWASEGPIYQRFGYGLASLNAPFDIERANTGFRQLGDWTGRLRLVEAAEAGTLMPPVYDAVAAGGPGFFVRNERWWSELILADPERWRRGASRKFFVVHERDGRPTGYAIYRIKSEWGEHGSRSELRVQEALAVDPAAERDLWRYLFGVDLIHRVVLHHGPIDQPLLLQLEHPDRLGLRARDGVWVRILDVSAALAGRGYADDGTLALEVRDGFMPEVAGRWRLTVDGGRARVEPTAEPAELAMEVNDLGSVFLGGFSFAELARAGRVDELVPGARRRADRLFGSPLKPWCPYIF